jgi:hypothetical protein
MLGIALDWPESRGKQSSASSGRKMIVTKRPKGRNAAIVAALSTPDGNIFMDHEIDNYTGAEVR